MPLPTGRALADTLDRGDVGAGALLSRRQPWQWRDGVADLAAGEITGIGVDGTLPHVGLTLEDLQRFAIFCDNPSADVADVGALYCLTGEKAG